MTAASESQKVSPFRDVPPSSAETMVPPLPEKQRSSPAASFDRLVEVNLALTSSVTQLVRVLWCVIAAVGVLEIARFIVR